MKTIANSRYIKTFYSPLAMALLLFSGAVSCNSCSDFTEVELPNSQLAGDAVYENTTTANAVMAGIYSKLRDGGILTGLPAGLSSQLGHYADELDFYGSPSSTTQTFYNNALLPSTRDVSGLWNHAYNIIYSCNAVIEGVASSQSLPQQDRERLTGEALLVRSLMHFYLASLYGEVPYITTTDYRVNTVVAKVSVAAMYENLIADLQQAILLLPQQYTNALREIPNRAVTQALLARVYLYAGKWAEAAEMASAVLSNPLFVWDTPLDQVFLKEAPTTIWQLSPATEGKNTNEGATFIFESAPPAFTALSTALVSAFQDGDQRREVWVREIQGDTNLYCHAFKYKERTATAVSLEYSVLFRLAEQYLIRAEARTRQGDLVGGSDDLNKVRTRAGLSDTPAAMQQELLEAILEERRVEFFTELGHRFFDLKRYGWLDSELSSAKPGWDSTDGVLPLPETELLANPNLLPQNPGY